MAADFMNLFGRKLALVCFNPNATAISADFPVWVGGQGAHLEVESSDRAVAEIERNGETLKLKLYSAANVFVNGQPAQVETVYPDQDYAVLADSHVILLAWSRDARGWLNSRARDEWRVVTAGNKNLAGPVGLETLQHLCADALEADHDAILHQSFSTTGFYLRHVARALGWDTESRKPKVHATDRATAMSSPPVRPEEPEPDVNTETGQYTCPACWIRFDRGDVLHVAAHASLKGDPVLGEDEMLRFSATRFNDAGMALDAMGVPASEMACPHCRRTLPPSFLDLRQHIVSIVGAPSSGKSYFLSVLIKMLQGTLFTKFQAAFHDGDPKENVRLTEMKNKLFSASSPNEARIAKTDLEGDMYIEVPRRGRRVRMPKPFVFTVAPLKNSEETFSVVFYDNAGEHFEPARDSDSSPGAQHVATASGLLFLFDPTYNIEFRKRLRGHHDPQLSDQRFDQQDTLLAEMNARIKKLRGIDFRERVDTPLAVVVGKSDVWEHLAGSERFTDPLWDSALDMGVIARNSEKLRNLLIEVVPAIVANAEAISNNVLYFPASNFGCSPENLGNDSNGKPVFSPDPNKLNPRFVEIPALWLMSRFEPCVVAVRE